MAHKKKTRKKTLPLLLAALTLAGAGLWWGNYTLSTEEYTFSSRRLPEGWDGARIVVLSDLHGRQFGRDNRRLAAAVEAAHPDVIALVGDFVDEWTDPAYLRPLLERLTALAPCYFVSGNHEWAAARLGLETVCLTINLDAVGNMPCNPAIGGTAKGHLVRELDALGGEMARAADRACIQYRMLNRRKGPAVWSLRAQADRRAYQQVMKHTLEMQEHLTLRQAEAVALRTENGRVTGVVLRPGAVYLSLINN